MLWMKIRNILYFSSIILVSLWASNKWIYEEGNVMRWFLSSRMDLAHQTQLEAVVINQADLSDILSKNSFIMPKQKTKLDLSTHQSKADLAADRLYLLLSATPTSIAPWGFVDVAINNTYKTNLSVWYFMSPTSKGYHYIGIVPIPASSVLSEKSPLMPIIEPFWEKLYYVR